MAFSDRASSFIGTLEYAFFRNMFNASLDDGTVPEISNAIFESMFCYVTSALMIGSLADRGRILPAVVFIFVWSTLVYDPIACWTWNPNGWASKMGYLDYAGGTPVHVAAGFGALALSFMLGKRIETKDEAVTYRPHSIMFVVIGTFFMWVGWFGFNTGTSLAPTMRAAQALLNTQVSASFGGLTWAILDYRLARKWSVVGFCSGVIAGLVAITPAAGYVPAWAAVISGVLGGMAANFGTKLKFFLGIDDSLDVFAVHGLGAIVGNVVTGLFASKTIAALDGSTTIDGGWIEHHYIQLGYQIAGTVAAAAYSFVVTVLILFVIKHIPGLHLRVTPEEEEVGLDSAEHDEYAFDYVELFPSLPSQHELWGDSAEDYDGPTYESTHKEDRPDPPKSLLSRLFMRRTETTPDIEMADSPAGEKMRRKESEHEHEFVSMAVKKHSHTTSPSQTPTAEPSFHEMSMFPKKNTHESRSHKAVQYEDANSEPHHMHNDHEAIEGGSTYRRIQEQLDLSRWRGHIGGGGGSHSHIPRSGLLSRTTSFVSDRLSNLSPTATPSHQPQTQVQMEALSQLNDVPSEVSSHALEPESVRSTSPENKNARPLIEGSVYSGRSGDVKL